MKTNKIFLFTFKLILIAIAFYIVDQPFITARIDEYLVREIHGKLVGYLFQLFLAVLLVTLFSISKNWIKYSFLLLLLVSSIAYRTYYNAVGNHMLFSDLVTLFEARAQLENAFLAYSSAFYKSLLLHIPLLIVYLLFPSLQLRWKATGVTAAIYLTLLIIFTFSLINTQGRGLLGRPGFIQTPVQSIVYFYSIATDKTKVNEKLKPSERPDYTQFEVEDQGLKTLLMVIDESITWDLIDLNSDLNVTPILKEFPKENIMNFGKAISYANCSDISNASIRKFVRYGEEEADLLGTDVVYMWEVAKKAGYTPYLLDVQRDGLNHNYFTAEELSEINIIPVKGMDDGELIGVVKNLLADAPKDEKQFILIIKGGSHFPYTKVGEDLFTPAMPTSSMNNSSVLEVFNSYRNLAYYETNTFFKEVLEKLNFRNDVALVYTSDHGQSFKNIRKQATHCNTKNTELTEAVVPFFVIAPERVLDLPVITEIKESPKIKSHYLIPAVLMDLLGFKVTDIAEFTQYPKVLDPNNPNHFTYKRAVPLFEADAEKYEVDDQKVRDLGNQDVENYK